MKIIECEDYEELAIEWQFKMITLLKEKLIENKIDSKIAEKICGDFIFDFSMIHDQGEVNGLKPVICFDNLNNELIYNSQENFDLHDYAFGSTSLAFEKPSS